MNSDRACALAAFLQAVRTRLWLQAALRWTWRGLAPTALWLSGAGLIHSLAYALPLTLCLTVGLAPVGAALLLGLWRGRPPLDRCARTADRWFDGAAILTSAWELYRHPDAASPASRRLIQQQAQHAVAAWRGRLRRRPLHATPPKYAPLAIGLSLIGIFLLTTPGAMPERQNPALRSVTPTSLAAADPAVLSVRRENSTAATAPAQPPPSSEPNPAGPAAPVIQPPATPPAAPSQRRATDAASGDDATATAAAGSTGEDPAAWAGGSNEPGDSPAAHSNAIPPDAAGGAVQWVDWARAPSAQSPAAGATALELTIASAPASPAPPAAVSAAQVADMQYEASFGPALRPYIARYFELLHDHQPDHRSAEPAR